MGARRRRSAVVVRDAYVSETLLPIAAPTSPASATIISTPVSCPSSNAMAPMATPALPARNVQPLTMPEFWPRWAGESDDKALGPVNHDWSPADVAASFYHNLGIDHHKEYHTSTGRPVMIVREGEIIPELFA